MNYRDRSECGRLNLSDALCDVGRQIHLFGWVDSLRDHGDVLFIHLRDRSGITSSHHPFTAPDRTDFDPKDNDKIFDPLKIIYYIILQVQVFLDSIERKQNEKCP